jgi:2-hydroxy-6-oxonona-2,4-dienedioate hydrolase
MRTTSTTPTARIEPPEEFLRAERRILDRYHSPAVPRSVALPDGNRARVLTVGEGPPVLLVIGGGMVAGMWAPLLPQLDGFTAHLVDPPWTGLSDLADFRRGALRTTAVRFLEGVLDGLELERATVVGHSMGGLWSTWLTLDRADRVQALAHVGCPALVLGTSAPLPMRLSTVSPLHRVISRLDPPSPEQVDRMARMAHEDFHDLPELRDLFVAAERVPHADARFHDLLRAAIRVRGARPDVALGADELRRIHRPLQVIWGEDDPFGRPAVGRRMIGSVPDGEIDVVAGGHAPWFSHADQVGPPLADFLSRQARSAPAGDISPVAHGRTR